MVPTMVTAAKDKAVTRDFKRIGVPATFTDGDGGVPAGRGARRETGRVGMGYESGTVAQVGNG